MKKSLGTAEQQGYLLRLAEPPDDKVRVIGRKNGVLYLTADHGGFLLHAPDMAKALSLIKRIEVTDKVFGGDRLVAQTFRTVVAASEIAKKIRKFCGIAFEIRLVEIRMEMVQLGDAKDIKAFRKRTRKHE